MIVQCQGSHEPLLEPPYIFTSDFVVDFYESAKRKTLFSTATKSGHLGNTFNKMKLRNDKHQFQRYSTFDLYFHALTI